jgi:hypothetical protein
MYRGQPKIHTSKQGRRQPRISEGAETISGGGGGLKPKMFSKNMVHTGGSVWILGGVVVVAICIYY